MSKNVDWSKLLKALITVLTSLAEKLKASFGFSLAFH